MSKRSNVYISPYADKGPCMAVDCPHRAQYCTVTTHWCAVRHWRHYLVAKVVERQLYSIHATEEQRAELAQWRQCIRMATTQDVLMLLALFGDGLVGKVDDVDRRGVDEIIAAYQRAG